MLRDVLDKFSKLKGKDWKVDTVDIHFSNNLLEANFCGDAVPQLVEGMETVKIDVVLKAPGRHETAFHIPAEFYLDEYGATFRVVNSELIWDRGYTMFPQPGNVGVTTYHVFGVVYM